MASKANPLPNPQREERQRLINAAPCIKDFAGVDEVHVELKFADPEGKQEPSPRGSTYTGDMHAYFQYTCPMRDCTGGGYDANADLQRALAKRRGGHTGTLSCKGIRPRGGLKNVPCNIELQYTLVLRGKLSAAA